MARRPHRIKSGSSSATVRHALFFDTETTQETIGPGKVLHHLAFGWLCYRRRKPSGEWTTGKWTRFSDATTFWDTVVGLAPPKERIVLVCHNTGFDLAVLDPFSALPSRGWRLGFACIEAPPTILKWRKDRAVIEILDSLNFWREPLAQIGERVGLPKLEFPDGWSDRRTADRYCRRDVEIVATACTDWWDWIQANDMGKAAATLASQAMTAYKHRFMNHTIYIDDCERATELSRSAYHGGRVECFRIGYYRGSFHLLDVRSMYPHVMASGVFPTRLVHSVKSYSLADLAAALVQYSVVADVTIKTDEPAYPVRDGLRLYFPIGTFRARLSTAELDHAIARGHIAEVHRVAVYESAPIFRAFVLEMYARRRACIEAGDLVGARQFKILLNSLYGKFGQRGIVWDTAEDALTLETEQWAEVEAGTGRITKFRQFGGIVQTQAADQESRDSFPAIASHVTAAARIYLWSLIMQAGRDHVIYTDTDSLLVDDVGYARLAHRIHESDLGALGCDGHTDRIRIWGAKDYDLGFKSRTKGVRKTAKWLEWDLVTQERWSGLGRALFDEKLGGPTTTRQRKRLARRYTKGVVHSDGRITPHVLTLPG